MPGDERRRADVVRVLVTDDDRGDELIQERKLMGADRYDEVWDGVYVMPSMPSLEHQELVHDLDAIFDDIVVRPGQGKVYPGVNVSDRGRDWKKNFRVPDLVVILKNSRAIRHSIHIQGDRTFSSRSKVQVMTPRRRFPSTAGSASTNYSSSTAISGHCGYCGMTGMNGCS